MNDPFFQELAKVLHEVLDEHRKRQEERKGNVCVRHQIVHNNLLTVQ